LVRVTTFAMMERAKVSECVRVCDGNSEVGAIEGAREVGARDGDPPVGDIVGERAGAC